MSTGGIAAIARIAACGLTNPRAWRTSSGTLVSCVKYARVCVSPGPTPREKEESEKVRRARRRRGSASDV